MTSGAMPSALSPAPDAVLLVGGPAAEEMRAVVDLLRRRETACEHRYAADCHSACAVLAASEWRPGLIVVLQAHSDQYSAAEVLDLLARAPLARIVCVYGSWCASDGRTRTIWPLACRVPAPYATWRISRELDELRQSVESKSRLPRSKGNASAFLPLTASRAELFGADFGGFEPGAPAFGAVTVDSGDRAWRRMIETAIAAAGGEPAANPTDGSTGALLWDADPLSPSRLADLRLARAGSPGTRIIACTGLPTPDIEPSLRRCGADAVWFKLAPLEDLFELLSSPPEHGQAADPRGGIPVIPARGA